MFLRTLVALCIPFGVALSPCSARADGPDVEPHVDVDGHSDGLVVDAALGFSRFEQQVKSEVGGASAEPLVQEQSGSLALTATYRVAPFLRLGLFAEVDVGRRAVRSFLQLDPEGTPLVTEARGGSFRELWFGPLLRLQWRMLFFDAGWALVGRRWDDARLDLPDADGDSAAPLRTSRRIAWRFGLGAEVPLVEGVTLSLRVQYRVRYYDRRRRALANDVVHGTQGISPSVGIMWRPRLRAR